MVHFRSRLGPFRPGSNFGRKLENDTFLSDFQPL